MTTTKLKIIALISMFIDHVGQFISNTPEWFHWVGRIAAPVFIYALIIGYQYTLDRKKYIIRLYLCTLGMAILNLIINIVFNETQMYITNNFFAPLFLIIIFIYFFEKKQIKYVLFLVVWQMLVFLISMLFSEIDWRFISDASVVYQFFGSIFGSVFFVEGGPFFVLLGLLLYVTRKTKIGISVVYILFSIFCYVVYSKWGYRPDFFAEYLIQYAGYQWIMIIALPLILLYNGKKGIGLKYFFYVFYPVHILILYLIGVYLSQLG
ncbi:TraX family protein [Oceanobacillus profundus]|uniref:Conjugal transfer protein TraX n=1 Tax=Oceanobacillus profundus TaxID=372463 RepID=A0A417YBD9_9BACI|nr:TraX family protein [Oceanobacillus profundus]MBR3118831.1 hypothetical protein [Oceanobacillus sp.]PAE27827.1 hypothetical protein CHI07_17575 [Paenibacillus sp. 7884-2]MCM3400052.1 conjugal transfer protein TraX [Oceanobacillus profundus]MDO6450894.1 TraX family protein [Oceanobacillus profundus]RHW30003.1 hypothetical protein D1B32_19305 [Oceanobacillus profundus]